MRSKKYLNEKIQKMEKYKFNSAQDEAPKEDGATPPAKDDATAKDDGAKADADVEAEFLREEKKKKAVARSNKIRQLQKEFGGKKKQLELFASGNEYQDKPMLILENQENIPDDYSKLEATKECELK